MNASRDTERADAPPASLPTLRTRRLRLRPRTLADLEACLAMDRDPEVARFVPGPWGDPERHRAFVIARMTTTFPPGLGYWTVVPRENARAFLGWIMLTPLEIGAPAVEIGWRFVRAARRRGFATEAARPVLAHALVALGLPEVVADIDADNAASIRVAEKLGMVATGPAPCTLPAIRFVARRPRAPAARS